MNSKQTLDQLIALAEKQVVELDSRNRSIAQIEFEGDIPKEIIEARVMSGLMGEA